MEFWWSQIRGNPTWKTSFFLSWVEFFSPGKMLTVDSNSSWDSGGESLESPEYKYLYFLTTFPFLSFVLEAIWYFNVCQYWREILTFIVSPLPSWPQVVVNPAKSNRFPAMLSIISPQNYQWLRWPLEIDSCIELGKNPSGSYSNHKVASLNWKF